MQSARPTGLDALALEQYELMLAEQAIPFEEKAIDIHATNAARSRRGVYDQWVRRSFEALASLMPARYAKAERIDIDTGNASTAETASREVSALNREAVALREQGRFAAAEQTYLAALSEAPDAPAIHYNIGILYDLYLGIPGKALYHYERYRELSGDGDRRVAGWIADLQRREISLARDI